MRTGRTWIQGTLTVAAALTVGACGSSTNTPRTTGTKPVAPTSTATAPPAAGRSAVAATTGAAGTTAGRATTVATPPARPNPSRTLRLVLAAVAPPAGSAHATIRVFGGEGEICWHFSKVVGVQHPSSAEVRLAAGGAAGEPWLGLGPYKATGCKTVAPRLSDLIRQINQIPANFLVVVNAASGGTATQRLRAPLAPPPAPTLLNTP